MSPENKLSTRSFYFRSGPDLALFSFFFALRFWRFSGEGENVRIFFMRLLVFGSVFERGVGEICGEGGVGLSGWLYFWLFVLFCSGLAWRAVCLYVCLYVCMYVYMYVCMYICMYVCYVAYTVLTRLGAGGKRVGLVWIG